MSKKESTAEAKKETKKESETEEPKPKKKSKKESAKKPKKKNLHDGHRSRMRERYYNPNGGDSLEMHEFIELILYYALPRKNTNEIAHLLVNKFKTYSKILEANIDSLKEIEGISDNTALFFKILQDSCRRYNLEKAQENIDIKRKPYYGDYLIEYYKPEVSAEKVLLITLNAKMDMISSDIIYVGSVNSAKVDMHKMIKTALLKNASSVILAHNHPNGVAIPSPEDIETTKRILNIFNEVNINFIDHYVVSGNQIASVRDIMVKSYFD